LGDKSSKDVTKSLTPDINLTPPSVNKKNTRGMRGPRNTLHREAPPRGLNLFLSYVRTSVVVPLLRRGRLCVFQRCEYIFDS